MTFGAHLRKTATTPEIYFDPSLIRWFVFSLRFFLCIRWFPDRENRDVGVLLDLSASDHGHGTLHPKVLRWSRSASLCAVHRRLCLVLFSFHHHPCPRWHLGGMISFLPSISSMLGSVHYPICCSEYMFHLTVHMEYRFGLTRFELSSIYVYRSFDHLLALGRMS